MDRDYFIEDLRVINEINEFGNQIPFMRNVKFYKVRKNPLEELQEADFKNKYRFSRSTAVFIIDMVKDNLAGDARGGFIPPHLKVLTAIRTWARGEIQNDAGDLNGMSQPTVSLVCKQVALALVAQRAQWIKMPQTDTEQNNVIAGFYSLCGFRQGIGAIDCTHIRQVVSNMNLEIMDIVAHWRGSTHDSRIFNECRLKRRFERSEFKGRLLGDSGYACTPYLFTPILHPNTQKENMYNWAHIRTRNTVERCFGVWKQRFRCLLRGFTTKLEHTKLYIVALAILHNIAMHMQDLLEDVEDDDNGSRQDLIDNVPVIQAISLRGNAARAAFINENF